MSATVLTTGSEGYLGRLLTSALRSSPGVTVRRASSRVGTAGARAGSLVGLDVRSGWPTELSGIGGLVHLAWWGLEDFQSQQHLEQVEAHRRFLRGAMQAGVQRLVVAGTCFEYGLSEGELVEDLPLSPVTAYGEAKVRLLETVRRDAARLGVELLWARIFYPYGPGQRRRTIWSIVHEAIASGAASIPMSPGDQQRDFLPGEEVAGIMADLLRAPRWDHDVVNVSSGRPVAVKDLVASWIAAQGSSLRMDLGVLPYPNYEPFAFWGSRARLNANLATAERGPHDHSCLVDPQNGGRPRPCGPA